MAATMTKPSVTAELGVTVGTIFVASWGYDQTNVDFYEVVRVTPASVEVRPLAKRSVGNTGPHDSMVPVPGSYVGGKSMHRVSNGYKGTAEIKVGYHTWANPWDGQPEYQTGMGYGH